MNKAQIIIAIILTLLYSTILSLRIFWYQKLRVILLVSSLIALGIIIKSII